MKRIFFVLALSFWFLGTAQAERVASVSSANIAVPVTWLLGEDDMTVGTGLAWNKIILPDPKSFIGVDYGATLYLPVSRYVDGTQEFVHKSYFPALNLQGLFGLLFTPYFSPKYYLGLGGAFGMTAAFAMPAKGTLADSEFSLDFAIGGELRFGGLLTDRWALTAGLTVLYDFYKLDFAGRQYVPQNVLSVFPYIGFGVRGK